MCVCVCVYKGNRCFQWLYKTFLLSSLPSTCLYKYSCFINKSQYKKNFTFYIYMTWPEARTPQLIWWCRYRLDSRGTTVQFPEGAGIFLSSSPSISTVGSNQHSIQWVLEALSLGVKAVQCAACHLSPSTTKLKNQWSYISMPHMLFEIVGAQLYLTFMLVNVWYWTTNRRNCTALVTNSSAVHICNCLWDNRTAFMVISLQVTCKPAPTPSPTPTPSNMVFLIN